MRRGIVWVGVIVLMAACSGQTVESTQPAPVVPSAVPGVIVDKPDCKDTTRAQTTVQNFITSYNAGDLNATIAALDPNVRDYVDGAQGFRAGAQNFAAIRSHLSAMFSVHDHLTFANLKITVDPATALDDYYVIAEGVTRTDDSRLTKRAPSANGQLILGVHCLTPQISILSFETIG